MQDQDYITGLLEGRDATLKAIYKNFAGRITSHILKYGGTREDAKDVFQDALIIILQQAQSPDFQLTSQFYTYLFGICNLVFKAKRRKKSNQTVTITEEATLRDSFDIEKEITQRERDKIYKRNFGKLGEFCQQLLQLFFKKKNMTEIAEALNLKNEHTARTRKYRCQEKLKELMKKDPFFNEIMKDEGIHNL